MEHNGNDINEAIEDKNNYIIFSWILSDEDGYELLINIKQNSCFMEKECKDAFKYMVEEGNIFNSEILCAQGTINGATFQSGLFNYPTAVNVLSVFIWVMKLLVKAKYMYPESVVNVMENIKVAPYVDTGQDFNKELMHNIRYN